MRPFAKQGVEAALSSRLWPLQAVELAALTLGRAAGAALANEHPWLPLDHWDRRAVVDQALRRDCCADPLIDDDRHLDGALALDERLDTVADLHRRRRFGRGPVHANMTAPARGGRVRTGLIDADRPQPDVHPGRQRLAGLLDLGDAGFDDLRHEPVGKRLVCGETDRALAALVVGLQCDGVHVEVAIQGEMVLPIAEVHE